MPRFSDDPERSILLSIGSSKPRSFCTNIKSPLCDGLMGDATFELGQKTKNEMKKAKKWIIEMTNSDQRKREENKRRKEGANWVRFDGDRPERKRSTEESCSNTLCHDGDGPKIPLVARWVECCARNLLPVTFNSLITGGQWASLRLLSNTHG